ncbi:aminotransferase [unidentified eubacterium SCB49]|nr:aminotransferase [unidentified eubacterium SCB49]
MFIKSIGKVEQSVTSLESYFEPFRNQILGIDKTFTSPYGEKKIVYTDWTASGRLYTPLENKMKEDFGPFVANTHTETSVMGTTMTHAYQKARDIIKTHVGADEHDVLLTCGSGMTGVINKFQRILGLKAPENLQSQLDLDKLTRPVVFVTHMEHHSNQTSWLETIAEVVVIPCNEVGLFCLENFKEVLNTYKDAPYKIASITSCSNVTGIKTPYYEVARLMHEQNGLCFVDFACSGPYIDIDMHPADQPDSYLDAIFLSPHKFLGGPGTSGALVFNSKLYKNAVPDNPGGGTVAWTNPWGGHKYIDDIEVREDGGTPGFLQAIRISLAIKLKEKMGVDKMMAREHELLTILFSELENHPKIKILAGDHKDRLGVFSFVIEGIHHDLAVKILNDRYGIQSRGGCSCAGTYGHYLFDIDQPTSDGLIDKIFSGEFHLKPGWVRVSIHPTTTDDEVNFVCNAIKEVAENAQEWAKEYVIHGTTYHHVSEEKVVTSACQENWFEF